MKLYLGVASDKYELPLVVADTVVELAKITGIDPQTLRNRISKGYSGKITGIKFIKVEVTEDEN